MEEGDEYFTHPDRMRGATHRKQNAMMHQQLKSFEAMLNTFLERHETSSLYRALARLIPYNRQVCSLRSLNHYTNQWYSDGSNDGPIDDHTIIKRIEEFNQEIQYLKQMKTIFDDRIYSVLFEFYYEMVMEEIPQATKLVERGRRASSEVRGSNLLVMSNTEGYAALNKSMPVEKFHDISKDCEKLFGIIHQLQQIDVRWGSLLKSEDIDVELFDPDSVHDVKKYPKYLRFEAVLRLIPDVIRKTQNAIELSKSWWYQAERIRRRLGGQKIRDDTTSDQPPENYDSQSLPEDEPPKEQVIKEGDATKPFRSSSDHKPEAEPDHDEYTNYQDPTYRRKGRVHTDTDEDRSGRLIETIPYHSVDPTEEDRPLQSRATLETERIIPRHSYPTVIETVERRLRELSTSIALKQLDLAAETNELEFFNKRQQRIRKLRSNLKRAINAMEAMHDELKGYRREKEQLLLQLEDAEGLPERRHITGKLKTVDDKVKEVQELSQVIEYRHKLITSDLKLELDLKETFTRYQHEVRNRVDLLKSSVQEDEDTREQLSHELRLLGLQAGQDESDQEDSRDTKYMYNKADPNFPNVNKSRSVPRVPKNRIDDIPWLRSGNQSLDDSYQVNGELENGDRESFSPDLLDGQFPSVEPSRWDLEGFSADRKPLHRTASSPDLLNHMKRTSVDSGVNGIGVLNPDNTVRPRDSKQNAKLKLQMPMSSGDTSDFDSFKYIPNRSSNTTQNKRTAVPDIKYFPPTAKEKKRHRKPKAVEKSHSRGNGDDPSGYKGYKSRQKNYHQDTNHPDNSSRDREEERNMEQRKRPSAPSVNGELPTRNQQRQTRRSLGSNKKGAPIKRQPPLPQLQEEDDSSSAPLKGRTPRMYDPKRESLDSILSFYSPMLLNSYTPLSFEQRGKEELRDGGRSRKAKKTQGLKPKKSHHTDLLSPVYKPNQTQRSKQTQASRIPVKTSYS